MNKRLMASLTAALLLPCMACASESFDGSVVVGAVTEVTASFGGTVETVEVRQGQEVTAGDTAVTLSTTRVYAPEDGTVRLLDVQAGDSVDGTVLYLAPVSRYTIVCDLTKAYDSTETKYVRLGEKVYIQCVKDGSHLAEGRITAVDGSSYTVEATAGELYLQEAVYIDRSADHAVTSRLGKGVVTRASEVEVSASGSILALHVQDGERVERGQLLLETVTGELPAYVSSGSNAVIVDAAGVVTEVKVSAGTQVRQGETLCVVADPSSYQVVFSVPEEQLCLVQVGDTVQISLTWQANKGEALTGTITAISYAKEEAETAVSEQAPNAQQEAGNTASNEETEVTYLAYASLPAEAEVRLGMTVTVTVEQP